METNFKSWSRLYATMRTLAFTAIIGCVIATCVCAFITFSIYEDSTNSIYVVSDNGTVLAAKAEDKLHPAEAVNHITTFVENMYSFDENTYAQNIERALNLIGDDGRLLLEKLQKDDIYSMMVSRNLMFTVEVDSIGVDVSSAPYNGSFTVIQTITAGSGVSQDNVLSASFDLIRVGRSLKNPHGLKIVNYRGYTEPVR